MSSGQITRRAEFEKLGIEYVRLCVARGDANKDAAAEASAFLAELKDKQELEAASKRDAREEETLAIAKEANSIARLSLRSVRIDRYIAIAAVIIAAIAAREDIGSFIAWLSN